MWWKKNKWKVILPVLIAAVLAGAFWYGGSAPGLQGWTVKDGPALSDRAQDPPSAPDGTDVSQDGNRTEQTGGEASPGGGAQPPDDTGNAAVSAVDDTSDGPSDPEENMGAEETEEPAEESSPGVEQGDREYAQEQGMIIDAETGKDRYLTDPVPEGKPIPVEPQDVTFSDVTHTCTLSVRCDTILDHTDWLDPEKLELVPEDGVIFPETEVMFYEGESVFNLLQRELRKAGIHMEYEDTPIYNSAYIEGINNLYEFDCGELSGWMYKVNDWFPNYGCSRYQLREGDVVEWVYTCDLGVDVGGYYSTEG